MTKTWTSSNFYIGNIIKYKLVCRFHIMLISCVTYLFFLQRTTILPGPCCCFGGASISSSKAVFQRFMRQTDCPVGHWDKLHGSPKISYVSGRQISARQRVGSKKPGGHAAISGRIGITWFLTLLALFSLLSDCSWLANKLVIPNETCWFIQFQC